MKRYYYITLAAVFAIGLLQTFYVISLYNRYMDENIVWINEQLHIGIDKEWHIRNVKSEGRIPMKGQYFSIKSMKDMSTQEIDSLTHLHPLPKKQSLLNVDDARKKGTASTMMEFISQIMQDELFKKGYPVQLPILDSVFAEANQKQFNYSFSLYNKDKERIDSIGQCKHPDYTSELLPIGNKGLQYLQLKANIPLLPFIGQQIWPLILSLILMVFVVGCVAYHLLVIRRKDKLLQQREDTINGTIHDLKAPLNSVVTTLSWLESTEANAAKKKAVEISRIEVKHLVCNIELLLVTVRKDRKRLILKKEETDIPHLAEMVKNSMDALYRTKPHTIEIENRLPENIKVLADGMYIENVLRNLVENALKYSDNGVNVKVTLRIADGMLQVTVQDDGWGIAPQYQKKLFRQFYQVPRSADRICKGYGIGLAQSKYIIDAHKGKISVKSTAEQGSEFSFNIPVK